MMPLARRHRPGQTVSEVRVRFGLRGEQLTVSWEPMKVLSRNEVRGEGVREYSAVTAPHKITI